MFGDIAGFDKSFDELKLSSTCCREVWKSKGCKINRSERTSDKKTRCL